MHLATTTELRALLDRALAAWRVHRHPDLADAVASLCNELFELRPTADDERGELYFSILDGTLRVSTRLGRGPWGAWYEREARGDPVDFDVLSGFGPSTSEEELRKRVELLSRRDDPRFARLLLELMSRHMELGDTTWDFLADAFVRAREYSQPALLGPLEAPWPEISRERAARLRRMTEALQEATPPPLSTELRQLVVDVSRAVGPQQLSPDDEAAARDFVHQLALTPDDDAPRRVLADFFLERGDLRGEFIRTQLDGLDPSPALRRRARSTWLDTRSGHLGFARGLPRAVHLPRDRAAALALAEQPWFPLVREVDLAGATRDRSEVAAALALLDHPAAQHVDTVTGLLPGLLGRLSRTPRRWTTLGVQSEHRITSRAFLAFPALRRLRLGSVGRVAADAFRATPHLEELDLDCATRSFATTASSPDEAVEVPESVRVLRLAGVARLSARRTPLRLRELHVDTETWPLPPGRHEVEALFLGPRFVPRAANLRRLLGLRRLTVTPRRLVRLEQYLGDNTELVELELKGELNERRVRLPGELTPRPPERVLGGLARLEQLEALTLQAQPEDLGALPPLRRLRSLTLSSAQAWFPRDTRALEALLARLPRLETLALPACDPGLLDEVLGVIQPTLATSSLRTVTLGRTWRAEQK